ncbi:MAG TPA: hypothetical protein VFB34_07165 [Chloroflexota bacterium]|nr:hypothetical protein [Chloroflexota bacterium]
MDAAKEIVAKLEALEDQRLAIERELKRLRVSPAPGSAGANRRRVPLRASVSGVGGFRAAFVAAAVLAAVVAVAQSAVASIPDANGVIHACYHVDGRGRTDEGSSLRVIDPAAKYDGGTCRRDERALSWNQTGPRGPIGPAGMNWQGQWSAARSYGIKDAVFDGGSAWIALQPNTNSEPATGNSNWSLLAQKGDQGAPGQNGQTGPAGLTWQGQWSSTQSYAINDAVFDGGSAWIALQPNTNSEPAPSNANWSLLAQKGDQGNQGPAGVIHGYDAQLSPTGNLPVVPMAPIPPNSSPGALGAAVNVLQTAPVATSGTYYVTATAIAFVSPLDQVYCFLGTQSNNTATDGIFGAATDEGTSTPLFPHYTVSVTLPMTLSAGDKMTLYCYSSTGNTSSGIVDASITALPVNMATTASNAIQANLRARSTKRAISRLGGRRNR